MIILIFTLALIPHLLTKMHQKQLFQIPFFQINESFIDSVNDFARPQTG